MGFPNHREKVGQNFHQLNIQEEVSQDVLSELNFELKSGELMIVVGSVGSGKTSLLHALMNETNRTGGSHCVEGKIAYVEQEPFIFSASIIDNVCFGLDYEPEKFEVALRKS